MKKKGNGVAVRQKAPRAALLGPSVTPAAPGAAVSVYECRVFLVPEPEVGGFSCLVAELPGAVSQGETEDEALANIIEALEGVLESYLDHGVPIPWRKPIRKPRGAISHTVVVHA
jgi:predicted RNase H-like HicB family nuclease